MRKTFEFEVDGKKREFRLGSYAILEMLSDMGIDPSDITQLFDPVNEIKSVVSFMFHSGVYHFDRLGQKPDFVRGDIYDWIDITGGFSGEFFQSFRTAMIESIGLVEKAPEEETESEGQIKKK